MPGDLTPSRQKALLAGPYSLESTAVLLSARAAHDQATAPLLLAANPETILVQGQRRANARPAPLVDLSLASAAASGDDADETTAEPAWHETAAEGPLRFEIYPGGYRLLEGH